MAPDEESLKETVGHTDGEVLPDGETIIYDYDEKGNFVGWHKKPVGDPDPVSGPPDTEQEIIPDPNELQEDTNG